MTHPAPTPGAIVANRHRSGDPTEDARTYRVLRVGSVFGRRYVCLEPTDGAWREHFIDADSFWRMYRPEPAVRCAVCRRGKPGRVAKCDGAALVRVEPMVPWVCRKDRRAA